MVSQPKRKNVKYSSDIISKINNWLVIFRGMGSIFHADIYIIALGQGPWLMSSALMVLYTHSWDLGAYHAE